MAGMQRVLGLVVEWYDTQAQLVREFVLRYFLEDDTVEMIDPKNRKTFLRKTPAPPALRPPDLYLGNQVMLHSRALTIKSFADRSTADHLSGAEAFSVAVLSPDAYRTRKVGAALASLTSSGLALKQVKMVHLNRAEADELIALLYASNAPVDQLAALWTSGPAVLATFAAQDAHAKTLAATKATAAMFGANGVEATVVCPASLPAAAAVLEFGFGASRKFARSPTASFGDCTCCVIRPHAVKGGDSGAILAHIEGAGYNITAMETFKLDLAQASEFLEVYNGVVYEGVVPEYRDAVVELASGPCLALELRGPPAVAEAFRETAGPWDVDFAKEIRKTTIRAKFGVDRVKNAVHCTDLPDDAESEVHYFFDVLQGQQQDR